MIASPWKIGKGQLDHASDIDPDTSDGPHEIFGTTVSEADRCGGKSSREYFLRLQHQRLETFLDRHPRFGKNVDKGRQKLKAAQAALAAHTEDADEEGEVYGNMYTEAVEEAAMSLRQLLKQAAATMMSDAGS